MSSGKVLLGVLAGVAAGALLGILFAPDKGSVTRKKIAKKSEDFADELKAKFDELVDSMSEKFDKVKEDITDSAKQSDAGSGRVEKEPKTAKA